MVLVTGSDNEIRILRSNVKFESSVNSGVSSVKFCLKKKKKAEAAEHKTMWDIQVSKVYLRCELKIN